MSDGAGLACWHGGAGMIAKFRIEVLIKKYTLGAPPPFTILDGFNFQGDPVKDPYPLHRISAE